MSGTYVHISFKNIIMTTFLSHFTVREILVFLSDQLFSFYGMYFVVFPSNNRYSKHKQQYKILQQGIVQKQRKISANLILLRRSQCTRCLASRDDCNNEMCASLPNHLQIAGCHLNVHIRTQHIHSPFFRHLDKI